jgi:mannose-6-phosphate isomerase-like protein (cupin superfamily)
MNSIKGVIASLVLFFGFLPTANPIQVVEKQALPINAAKHPMAPAIEEARVDDANFFSPGRPQDSSSSRVTYFNSQQVASSFAAAGNGFSVLYDGQKEGMSFEVRTDRREGPGTANVHALFAEIYIVEAGTATYVSGGTVVDPRTSEPNEIRGSAIEHGETRQLAKGDVVIVPKGVPHWFKDAQGPLLYYLVRIR